MNWKIFFIVILIPFHWFGTVVTVYNYRCNATFCRQSASYQQLRSIPTTASLSQPRVSFQQAYSQRGHKQCQTGFCQFYYECAVKESPQPKFCLMNNGFTGVCCNDARKAAKPKPQLSALGNIRGEEIEVNQIIKDLERLEDELVQNEIIPGQNTKELSHENFFGGDQNTLKEMHNAIQILQNFIRFSKREHLSPDVILHGGFDIKSTYLAGLCEPAPVCDDIIYRKPDGTCNNLINTNQGKAVSTFSRLLWPDYGDGINSPRLAKDGTELPNARMISLSLSPEATSENSFYSMMLAQFGQFVAHDLTRSAITRTHDNHKISCCNDKVIHNPRLLHPACFPITVPSEDLFLRSESQFCINFVRSAPAINPKCQFGPREQLNQLSSYLDGNNIYGASSKESAELRLFRGGLMKTSIVDNRPFPPQKANDTNFNCQIPKSLNMHCFLGGDIRSNENIDLVVLHTIWLREHNRIASYLAQLNPYWSDEIIYQETKRIVVAEFQHIIYNEFLPYLLGPKTMEHYGLKLSNGFIDTYNPAVDATILNEFAVAAYRLHSLVQGTLNMNTAENQVLGQVYLRDSFFNPTLLYHQGVFQMRIAGLTGQAIQSFDNFFSQDVTNHLFQIPGKRFGLDLVALNIQRGRDHGIQGYTNYREICGLSKVSSFSDLKTAFSNPEVAHVMSHLYKQVQDVDLFIAGTSEKALPGAIVGPTFACIIGEQFRRIKEGDRFWYENGNLPSSFKPSQLVEIKKTTFAKILCDNTDVEKMQPFPLLMPSQSNPKIKCDRFGSIDLNRWRQF